VNYHFGFAIESMVSVLLLLTILYCVRLNRQLRLLKADEQTLRVTISELVTATEIAERAIAGLKQTMREGEQGLTSRLQRSEELSGEIEQKMKAAEGLLAKLTRIATVGRSAPEPCAAGSESSRRRGPGFHRTGARPLEWAGGVKRFWRDVRLIPVVLLAMVALFALKVSGLVFDGGYTLAERLQNRDTTGLKVTTAESVPQFTKIVVADAAAPNSTAQPAPTKPWAREMFNFNADSRDITGSVGEKKEGKNDEKHGDKTPTKIDGMPVSNEPPEATKVEVGGAVVQGIPGRAASPGERAVLERLQERRQELDSRSRDLDMRENLLKAAEQRMDAKFSELKTMETRIDHADTQRQQTDSEHFKNIVAMYENMKAKDAARIFDRLDMKILVEVTTRLKPAKLAEIAGVMSPEAAERLTVELARRASGGKVAGDQLPKIEGRPTAH